MFLLYSQNSKQFHLEKWTPKRFLGKKSFLQVLKKIFPNQKKFEQTKEPILLKLSSNFSFHYKNLKVVAGCKITNFSAPFSSIFFYPCYSNPKKFTQILKKARIILKFFLKKISPQKNPDFFPGFFRVLRNVLNVSFLKNTSLTTFYKKLIILKFFV